MPLGLRLCPTSLLAPRVTSQMLREQHSLCARDTARHFANYTVCAQSAGALIALPLGVYVQIPMTVVEPGESSSQCVRRYAK